MKKNLFFIHLLLLCVVTGSVFPITYFFQEKHPYFEKNDGVEFYYYDNVKKSIFLVGEFNNWQRNLKMKPGTISIKDKKIPVWKIKLKLPPRKQPYQYKYLVDGQWLHDAVNPKVYQDRYGQSFSLAEIKSKPQRERYITRSSRGITHFQYIPTSGENIKTVFLTGSFNNWNTQSHQMQEENNTFILSLPLLKGQYTFCFFADGKFVVPENTTVYYLNVTNDKVLVLNVP